MSKLFEPRRIKGMEIANRFVRSASGDLAKAACLSDNLCRGPLLEGRGIYCVVEKKKNERNFNG